MPQARKGGSQFEQHRAGGDEMNLLGFDLIEQAASLFVVPVRAGTQRDQKTGVDEPAFHRMRLDADFEGGGIVRRQIERKGAGRAEQPAFRLARCDSAHFDFDNLSWRQACVNQADRAFAFLARLINHHSLREHDAHAGCLLSIGMRPFYSRQLRQSSGEAIAREKQSQ